MHNLVPDLILNEYAQQKKSGAFQAIGLFVDVSGFSTITDTLMQHGQHGAEVLAVIMRTIFDPFVASVYAQGGFITGFAGDAFTALFNIENPKQAPFERALAAAWHIQEHMARAAEQETPYGRFMLSVKVGLAEGNALWGVVSSDDGRRAAHYFRGSAIDDCALAEHQAGPGEIVASSGFIKHVKRLAVAEPAGDSYSDYWRIVQIKAVLPEPMAVDQPDGDLDLMSRFFPAAIVTKELSGEFRQIVSLFISLPTVRTEEQLAIFMRSLFSLENQYGGLLSRLDFGDKGSNLLLFWGTPAAHENDIERALNLVLALQILTSMPISAGVTYHTAHVGYIGSELREEYTCYGRGVNLAARLMVAAPRGEIWLDERVASWAERGYEIDFEGERFFKGFTQKQKVYALVERKESVEAFFQGPMVGRQAELSRLNSLVDPLIHGQYAGLIRIVGEAGLGKSRLVYAFRTCESLESLDHTWALCQADQTLRDAFNPFRYWLVRYFNQSEAQTEARNKRTFNRKLDDLIFATKDETLAGELDRTRSFLGALLDLYWPDSLFSQLDPQRRLENTFIALITLIKAESRQKPLILQLEDAHWLDDYSRELLQRLIGAVSEDPAGPCPLAIIVTSRPRDGSLVEAGPMVYEIALTDLADSDLNALAKELLGGLPAPELLELLSARAEGNPFFAEQILRHLKEGSWLELVDGLWQIDRTANDDFLPNDVRALLVARLDRLAQEVKELVQTASVLGREFEFQLLAAMLKDDKTIAQRAGQVEKADIWFLLGQLRYMFKHLMLQEAAYKMQVHSRRKALHRLAAETIASLYAEDLRHYYGEMAYHFEKAGDLLLAADNYVLAGKRAHEIGAIAEARSYFQRALDVIPVTDAERRWRALYGHQAASFILGDWERSRSDAAGLFQLAQVIGDNSRLAEAYFLIASNDEISGDDRAALQNLESALQVARSAGNRRIEVLALSMKVVGHARLVEMDSAQVYSQEALAAAEALGDERVLSQTLNNVANYYVAAGDYSRAVECLIRQVDITRHLGELVGQTLGGLNLAYNQLQLGLYQAARDTIQQSLISAKTLGAQRLQAYNYMNLCLASWRLGDIAAAREALSAARSALQNVNDVFAEAVCDTYLGLVLEAAGQPSEAVEVLGKAQQALLASGMASYASDAVAGLARNSLALEEHDQAVRFANELWGYLKQNGPDGLEFPILAFYSCAQVFERTGKMAEARQSIKTGYDELMGRANRISNIDWQRAFLDNVLEHKQMIELWEELMS